MKFERQAKENNDLRAQQVAIRFELGTHLDTLITLRLGELEKQSAKINTDTVGQGVTESRNSVAHQPNLPLDMTIYLKNFQTDVQTFQFIYHTTVQEAKFLQDNHSLHQC
jgi:hypothetical protein